MALVEFLAGSSSEQTMIRLYVAGAVVVLATPAFVAWRRGVLRPHGPEILLATAFYLSMYHAPVVRLLLRGGRDLGRRELAVLAAALPAALGVALVLSTRLHRPTEEPRAPASPDEASAAACAGLLIGLIGCAFFGVWATQVGFDRLFSARLGDVYLYATDSTAVTFQWPFMFGGIVTTARAFAEWPSGRPPRLLRAMHTALLVFFCAVTARLGARGPALELMIAIWLVRVGTRHPVSRRAALATAGILAAFFVFVSAMRTNLDEGITGTTRERVTEEAEESVSGESTTEFDNVFENHVMIVELAGIKIPFLEGESYASLPVQLIPRQIVAEKPQALSAWWIHYLDPELAKRGGGRAFGSFTEGYLNFGWAGAVVHVTVLTALLMAAYRLLRVKNIAVAPAAAILLAHSYHCHRSEALTVLFFARNAFIVAFLIMVLAWITTKVLFKDASRRLPEPAVPSQKGAAAVNTAEADPA